MRRLFRFSREIISNRDRAISKLGLKGRNTPHRNRPATTTDMSMITCYLRYVIDPYKLAEFEEYARLWIPIVNRMGGTHHGYFLPSEGANNIAVALFSFPSLAAYEDYRTRMASDPECQAAFELDKRNRSIVSYERSFMRPILG